MKLFQSLLVAPAALGLMAPLAVGASEVNLDDISAYSDVDSIEFANSFDKDVANDNQLIAGGEGLVSDSSFDGGFSETTTASFSADMYIGAVDDETSPTPADLNDADDTVTAGYSFQIDLNTSFTGEDSLDISLDAGNASSAGIAEFDGNSGGDQLTVDGVSYTFPIGDSVTFMVGDNTDGSALFTTACVYGGPSNTLDDCGNVNANITNGGVMAGAAYDFGNGTTFAVGYAGDETTVGTDEGGDDYAINLAYTGDNYGVSATYAIVDSDDGAATPVLDDFEDTFLAFNGYYTPDAAGFPSISVGFEFGEDGSTDNDNGVAAGNDSLTSYFLGLTWDEVGPGSAGVAMGTKTPTVESTNEQWMYEAYYSYPINDGMTITPLVFMKETSAEGIDDEKGLMVKTSFSF